MEQTQTTDKRLYSRNAIAYVIATTNLVPDFRVDEESGYVYAVFPTCWAVDSAVRAYKGGNATLVLDDFLRAFQLVKNTIYKIKHPEAQEKEEVIQ